MSYEDICPRSRGSGRPRWRSLQRRTSSAWSGCSRNWPAGFIHGFHAGANLYGAGGAAAYLLPEDDREMAEDEDPGEVAKARAAAVEVAP